MSYRDPDGKLTAHVDGNVKVRLTWDRAANTLRVDYLDAPVQRVTGADVHMPYSKRLEQAAIPHEEHVVKAALATLSGALGS